MIIDYLKNNILFIYEELTWEEAVKRSAQPLLENGDITQAYIDAIIDNVHENGPYFVLLPDIALPHARPENGSKRKGITCAVLEKPVLFPGDKQVRVLMAISSEGGDEHLEIMGELAGILMDDALVERLKSSKTVQDVISVFNN